MNVEVEDWSKKGSALKIGWTWLESLLKTMMFMIRNIYSGIHKTDPSYNFK